MSLNIDFIDEINELSAEETAYIEELLNFAALYEKIDAETEV